MLELDPRLSAIIPKGHLQAEVYLERGRRPE